MRSAFQRPELLTPAEMGEADALAIASGTPGIVLMERAGLAVAEAAARMAKTRGRIAILCGPGGNGGDGFIAARWLDAWGYRVELFLLGERDRLRGDPALAAASWRGEARPADGFEPSGADLVIDALYGAGLSRDVDGLARACVERINAYARNGGAVLSVDVPSGLDGETGLTRGAVVEAQASVTFFCLKPGHVLMPGRQFCGRLIVADIGIPPSSLDRIAPEAWLNLPAVWLGRLPRPGAASHKYSRGSALILSGPAHRTGASRMAAMAALRAGAGLVAVAASPEATPALAAHLTAVMIEPFEDLNGFSSLLADSRRNSLLIGPGAGSGERTRALVTAALVEKSGKPRALTLDADGITSFAGDAEGLARLIAAEGRETVLTPHEGEFARLFRGRDDVLSARGRLAKARAGAAATGAVLVYKGADTVVAAPDGRATIGCDLPPWLATAGSGDVLSGIVCGLLAQGMPAFEAASAAVWLHGAAARVLGPGLIAEDLPGALPGALATLMPAQPT